jgi:recombination DNA repair RAD52 pathway protein
MLSKEQRETLLRPINPIRVLELRGQSHLPSYDVVAHLTRVFGFEGWDKQLINLWLISELASEGRFTVTYGCTMRLTIYDITDELREPIKVIEEGATGSAKNQPSLADAHDFAMKNSMSYAIKRCAKDLGDQFGLSLYDKGSTRALVQRVIAYDMLEPVTDVAPTVMGSDENVEADVEVD